MSTKNAMTTDLDAIRERLNAAVHLGSQLTDSGDWAASYAASLRALWSTSHLNGLDIDLLAHAPTDIAALLAMVDHLRQKHAEVQETSMRRGEEISRLHGELRSIRT